MSNPWNDFNDAKPVSILIPKGTIAKVQLTIRPGGYADATQGWTGGYATRSSGGFVYLSCEFSVLEGPYARRKVFSPIGLYSPNGPDWGNIGRSLIRSILNSAHGFSDKDTSPPAQAARRIDGFADLDGLTFLAKINVRKDKNSEEEKNEIREAVTPDHKEYAAYMGQAGAPASPPPRSQPPAAGGRPTWAE